MNIDKITKEIKATYRDEYRKNLRNGVFYEFTHNLTKAGTMSGALCTGLAFVAMVGFGMAGGGYAVVVDAAAQGMAAMAMFTALSATALGGVIQTGKIIAQEKLNKDTKNGKLLTRFQKEIVPQRKRVLRQEASVEVKAFNEKKEARKEALNELNDVSTFPIEDFKSTFNEKSIRAQVTETVNKLVAKAASINPMKNKGQK